MKALTTLLFSILTVLAIADTPADILKDYRAKSAPALAKVNETLEKATVPIIADLVKTGDTTGADELKTQLKAKQDGEPVAKPHAKATSLFTLYDAARLKAIDPAQKAAVARIDAMLAGSDGKKIEVVAELGKARAEIEAGKAVAVAPVIPVEWTYHNSAEQKTPMAKVRFHPDGQFEMTGTQPGKWKPNRSGDEIVVTFQDRSVWKINVSTDTAIIHRPDVGDRYLRCVLQAATTPTVQQASK